MGRLPDALTRSVAERSLMGFHCIFNLLGYVSLDPGLFGQRQHARRLRSVRRRAERIRGGDGRSLPVTRTSTPGRARVGRPIVSALSTVALICVLATPPVWGASDDAEAIEVVVAARDLAFDPDVIRAPAGAELTVRRTNAGLVPHNIAFTLDSGEILSPEAVSDIIGSGDTVSVTFTTPGPGRYTFLCQIHPFEMTGKAPRRRDHDRCRACRRAASTPARCPSEGRSRQVPGHDVRVGVALHDGHAGPGDGSLLVAVNDADDAGLIGSTGKLLRMVDEDGDGVADFDVAGRHRGPGGRARAPRAA